MTGLHNTLAWEIRVLETPDEMGAAENLCRLVWPGSDLDVVPAHLLLTVVHNGGLVAGAFLGSELIGFVFGFPGLEETSEGLRLKHCSHQLGVHPAHRGTGVGFALKRFQWQFVRGQGLERVTWTYDPLLSRNAYLNIAKLGAICNTYLRDLYGEMRDELNVGLPSDRFQVDWWIATERVVACMQDRAVPRPSLTEYLDAGARPLNPWAGAGALQPPNLSELEGWSKTGRWPATVLMDIPADFLALKAANPDVALAWRLETRACFEALFAQGFTVMDFVYEEGSPARAVYVLK